MVYHLVYHSIAKKILNTKSLVLLLEQAQRKNDELEITGLLLSREEHIMQLLEGPEEVLEPFYQRIKKDPRHKHVLCLARASSETRLFPEWSMGFYHLPFIQKLVDGNLQQVMTPDIAWPTATSSTKPLIQLLQHFTVTKELVC